MTLHQISAAIPIFSGIFLLWGVVSKNGAPTALKPALAILAISGLIYGWLVLLLDEEIFRSFIGPRILTWLKGFKFFVGGIGTGAVLCSLAYGHWKSVWLSWRKKQRLP
jgi:hypothetical protein